MLTDQAHVLVDQLAKAFELIGVAIILGGIILATVAFLRDGSRKSGWRSGYPRYRSDWFEECGFEMVVVKSTVSAGFQFLSCWKNAPFAGFFVNVRDAKHVPGRRMPSMHLRKSDVSDAQWLQRLLGCLAPLRQVRAPPLNLPPSPT